MICFLSMVGFSQDSFSKQRRSTRFHCSVSCRQCCDHSCCSDFVDKEAISSLFCQSRCIALYFHSCCFVSVHYLCPCCPSMGVLACLTVIPALPFFFAEFFLCFFVSACLLDSSSCCSALSFSSSHFCSSSESMAV